MWDETGFFFDHLTHGDEPSTVLKVRSTVGIVPVFAIGILLKEHIEKLSGFRQRMDWFVKHKPHLARYFAVADCADPAIKGSSFIGLVPKRIPRRPWRALTLALPPRSSLRDRSGR